jgi:hypothetical protein
MVLYNYSEYRIAVQRMIDAFVGILGQDVDSIVKNVVHYWEEHHLAEDYPELIVACDKVLRFS